MRFSIMLMGMLAAVAVAGAAGPVATPPGAADTPAATAAKPVAAPSAEPAAEPEPAPPPNPLLSVPERPERAPDVFRVRFTTTQGDFVLQAHRNWAPHGVDRLHHLVKIGFYTDIAVFRVLDEFVAQFGIHGDPEVNAVWSAATIPADPVAGPSNARGYVTYAMGRSPDTRTTQLFINTGDNPMLDRMGFAPIGRVIEGMLVVDRFHSRYGEGPPQGRGPDQGRIQAEGNPYLRDRFPRLDYILKAEILP